MISFLIALIFFVFYPPAHAAEEAHTNDIRMQRLKVLPTRAPANADVILEYSDIIDDCVPDKICVQGQLYNQGKRPAHQVRLRIEIGGGKNTSPRTSFYSKLEQTLMEPGDRQDFAVMINRKTPYKDKGEIKIIEVGRYNFRIVPIWKDKAKAPPKR